MMELTTPGVTSKLLRLYPEPWLWFFIKNNMTTMAYPSTFRFSVTAVFALVILISIIFLSRAGRVPFGSGAVSFGDRPVLPAPARSPLIISFRGRDVLNEKPSSAQSSSPFWWLDSGARLYYARDYGTTLQGALPASDRWRLEYADSNPIDTDNGFFPQNIFRLVSRQEWKDFRQNLYFQIVRDNLSQSPNRNESNGVLLFNRYQDGDTLYYAGIRVDGTAVIKKKLRGAYYTLAQARVFDNGLPYDRSKNPNVLPKSQWIGIESRIKTLPDGAVSVELAVDRDGTGKWQTAVSALDDGRTFGNAILKSGFAGIRTDFMDIRFWRYQAAKL
jgi:hypothetical protein